MMHGLNFYRLPIRLFLPFVSLWVAVTPLSFAEGQTKDEFADFEKELANTEASASKPKEVAKPPQAKPTASPAAQPVASPSPIA